MKYWLSIPSGKVLLWYLILPVLILLLTEIHQAQTVIKEKVQIKPSKIIPTTALNTLESLYTVNFTVGWDDDIEGWIEMGGVNSGWVKGGASLSVTSPCKPSFGGLVKLNIPQYQTHYFNYSLEVVGLADTSGTGSLVGTNPSSFLGWPPTAYIIIPINNYSWYNVGFWNTSLTAKLDELCFGNTIVPWPNFHFGCDPLTTLYTADSINMKIDPEIQGVSFYSASGSKLGSEINVKLNESNSYRIKLNNLYKNINGDTIKVVSDIEGVKRTDSIIIPATDFSLESDTYNPTLIHDENKYLAIGAIPSSCLNLPLPDSIKYNVEILKGANLASLLNIMTDEKGDTLNNVDHYEGWLEFRLLGDGDNVETDDTIRVKVSTTYPQIAPIELSIIYLAPKIVVTFSPETIAPGDTADVFLMKRDNNGTLTEFPANQLFNIFIIDGQQYGTFYSPNWEVTNGYFYGILQGFKFIASEDIPEGTTVQATIAVETARGGGVGRIVPSDSNSFGIDNYSIKNKKLFKGTQSVAEEDEWYYGYGTITIGGGDCSDAPQCEGELQAPEFILIEHKNGEYFGIDGCKKTNQAGGFKPADNKMINTNEITYSLCYNTSRDSWEYHFNPINIHVIMDLCMDRIKLLGVKLRDNIEDIISEISENEACDVKNQILNHLPYPPRINPGQYLLKNVILKHESIHERNFKNRLDQARPQIQYQLEKLIIHCQDAPSEELAKKKWTDAYGKITQVLFNVVEQHSKMVGTYEDEWINTHSTWDVQGLIWEEYGKLRNHFNGFINCY